MPPDTPGRDLLSTFVVTDDYCLCSGCFFCATGLSQDLEELMVEGLLLQVCLPEVQSLFHVLLDRASSQHTNQCMSPPQDEPTDCDTHMQFNSQGNNLPLNQVQTVNHHIKVTETLLKNGLNIK